MKICVFCSAQDVPQKYSEAAKEFGKLIAAGGHTLVWGGTDRGLMKAVADGTHDNGGKIIGISMKLVEHKVRKDVDELLVAHDLSERKKLMLERSDAFVALAGGIGTLDEITEMLALKRHGVHNKPILFLNTDHFYEGTKTQFETMNKEGFLGNLDKDVVEGLESVAYFAETPQQAIEYIDSHGN